MLYRIDVTHLEKGKSFKEYYLTKRETFNRLQYLINAQQEINYEKKYEINYVARVGISTFWKCIKKL